MEQKFGNGDLAKLDGFTVKIVDCILDDDGWWYEVKPVDFDAPFTREVAQEKLQEV